MFKALTKLIFPVGCIGCGEAGADHLVCEECIQKININNCLFCGRCHARLALSKKVCHKDFPYLLGPAANYNDKLINRLIADLKFKSIKKAAEPLGQVLIRYAENIPFDWTTFTFIPIPLSRQRERERGFNQSEVIAEIVARHFGARLETASLKRIKNTKPQSELKFEERSRNILGAFEIARKDETKGKKVVLVDDVATSGKTFEEAARVLKEGGVRSVIALAVAKA